MKIHLLLALVAALTLFLAACGDDDGGESSDGDMNTATDSGDTSSDSGDTNTAVDPVVPEPCEFQEASGNLSAFVDANCDPDPGN